MEVKQIVELISKEKNIPRHLVVEGLKTALVKVAMKKFPNTKIEAEYDEYTGKVTLMGFKTVVESEPEMLDEETEIEIKEARKIDKDVVVGDEIGHPVDVEIGRIEANIVKQIIAGALNRAAQDKAYNKYVSEVGKVVSGMIQKVDKYGALVALKEGEGFIPRSEMIPFEKLLPNHPVEVLLKAVASEKGSTKIILSRKDKDLVVALFKEEVPELMDREIEIKECIREPGQRTKVIVTANRRINPVSAMIGVQGHRIQSVQKRLGNRERLDVVAYEEDLGLYLQNLLSGVALHQVIMDEETNELICQLKDKKDLDKAEGPRGINLLLASRATGYTVSVSRE